MRVELCSCRQRNTKDGGNQTLGRGEQGLTARHGSERAWPADTVTSDSWTQYISQYPVCGTLLRQPWETPTVSLFHFILKFKFIFFIS